MAKKSTTKTAPKKNNVRGISIKDSPLSNQEKDALAEIATNKKYWQRPKQKEEFAAKYNRIPKEVDTLVKGTSKLTDIVIKTKKGLGFKEGHKQHRESEPAPRQLKIEFNTIRIEGRSLIIEF